MSQNTLLLGGLIGLFGSIVVALMAYFVGRRNRAQAYYGGLVGLISDHNWKCLTHDVRSGHTVVSKDDKVSTVCYQHLNLLFYAWLHKEVIGSDGSMDGWKNWVQAIVEGAHLSGNEAYRLSYAQILLHGDLYPGKFREWLRKEMNLYAERFDGHQKAGEA